MRVRSRRHDEDEVRAANAEARSTPPLLRRHIYTPVSTHASEKRPRERRVDAASDAYERGLREVNGHLLRCSPPKGIV